MKTKTLKNIGIFVSFEILFAFIAWLGGFNFDQRGFLIAYWVSICLIVGAVLTALTAAVVSAE